MRAHLWRSVWHGQAATRRVAGWLFAARYWLGRGFCDLVGSLAPRLELCSGVTMRDFKPSMNADKRPWKTWLLSAFICVNLRPDLIASAAPLPLMPMPVRVETASGALQIDSGFTVVAACGDLRTQATIKRFEARITKQTG